MYLINYLRTLSVLHYKRILQRLPIVQQEHYIPFLILCHPRSGSTLLHTYLNSHPAIVSKGERVITDLRYHHQRIDQNYLTEKVFCPQPKQIKAVGAKFFVNLVAYPNGRVLIDHLNDIPNLKIILLNRRNLLRVILSNKIAEQTGQMSAWKKAHELSLESRSIYLDPKECLALLEKMEEEYDKARKSLDAKNHLTIFYEDLVSRKEATLYSIQKFLQVPPCKLLSLLRQQNPEPLCELISNYDDLAKSLKGSRWEYLLNEK